MLQRKKKIYLDNAAATQVDADIFAAMMPYMKDAYANPSALYRDAVNARKAIESARAQIAESLGAQTDTIFFTGSGTESCNLAIQGIINEITEPKESVTKPHIITTAIEHHAVLEPIKKMEQKGCAVTYLPVNKEGKINLSDVKKALRKETVLVSVMYANNEIGTVNPVADIGKEILKWRKKEKSNFPFFHIDACQASAYLDLHVERLHADFMSLNAGKVHGPKGVGILYKRRGIELQPCMYGGHQENGLRPGTENVSGIVGAGLAVAKAERKKVDNAQKIQEVRDFFFAEIKKHVPDSRLNGPELSDSQRLVNNLNVTFVGVDAESLILYLDSKGIQCSSGSACTTDTDDVSHVLRACGISEEAARQSVRFSLSKYTTKKDIVHVMKHLPKIIKKLRYAERRSDK